MVGIVHTALVLNKVVKFVGLGARGYSVLLGYSSRRMKRGETGKKLW